MSDEPRTYLPSDWFRKNFQTHVYDHAKAMAARKPFPQHAQPDAYLQTELSGQQHQLATGIYDYCQCIVCQDRRRGLKYRAYGSPLPLG